MYYLRAIYYSLYNVDWLQKQKKHTGKGFVYLLFISVVLSGIFSFYLAKEFPALVQEAMIFVQEEVPDISATVTNGELEIIGLEQPYTFIDREDGFIVYIDTTSDESVNLEDIIDVQSENGLVLSKTKLMFHDRQEASRTQTFYMSDVPNGTLTKQDIVDWGEKLLRSLSFVFFFLLWFVLFIGTLIGKGLYLLVLSFISWVVAQFGKKAWLFEEVYTVALFAQTLPSILMMILLFLGIDIPYAYSVLVIGILVFIVFQKPVHRTPGEIIDDVLGK